MTRREFWTDATARLETAGVEAPRRNVFWILEEVTGADTTAFQQVVESLWAPRTPPPTRKQWEARRRQQQELDK